MQKRSIFAALMLAAVTATAVYAAVTFDPITGEGFVGKGDVQLVFGWNNKQLQDNASSVQFRYAASEQVSWTCVDSDPSNPPFPATVHRNATTGVSGAPDNDPRQVKGQKQFTGFILSGYDGDPDVINEGDHEPYECGPNRTLLEGSEVVEPLGGGLEVSIDGTNWFPLQ